MNNIIADIKLCCGCFACASICPKQAINMQADEEGFFYPHIDRYKCIDCGKCKSTCPVNKDLKERKPILQYAAKSLDDNLRMNSSSGGIFSLLSKACFREKGIVYGAGWNHGSWDIIHKSASYEEELDDLRGSKYVQSIIGNIYSDVKEHLTNNVSYVLFTGTPCQIAALKSYLGREYDNLITVDLICHAVASPLAWHRYLELRCGELFSMMDENAVFSPIQKISFRQKNLGWKRYSLSINNNEYLASLDKDAFLRGFLKELYNRPSCSECHFRNLRSRSDITIGDYWGVQEKFPDMDDDKGTSLVLINTSKGMDFFSKIFENIEYCETTFGHAIKINPAIVRSNSMHPKREVFFRRLAEKDNFDQIVEQLLFISMPVLVYKNLKSLLYRCVHKALSFLK